MPACLCLCVYVYQLLPPCAGGVFGACVSPQRRGAAGCGHRGQPHGQLVLRPRRAGGRGAGAVAAAAAVVAAGRAAAAAVHDAGPPRAAGGGVRTQRRRAGGRCRGCVAVRRPSAARGRPAGGDARAGQHPGPREPGAGRARGTRGRRVRRDEAQPRRRHGVAGDAAPIQPEQRAPGAAQAARARGDVAGARVRPQVLHRRPGGNGDAVDARRRRGRRRRVARQPQERHLAHAQDRRSRRHGVRHDASAAGLRVRHAQRAWRRLQAAAVGVPHHRHRHRARHGAGVATVAAGPADTGRLGGGVAGVAADRWRVVLRGCRHRQVAGVAAAAPGLLRRGQGALRGRRVPGSGHCPQRRRRAVPDVGGGRRAGVCRARDHA